MLLPHLRHATAATLPLGHLPATGPPTHPISLLALPRNRPQTQTPPCPPPADWPPLLPRNRPQTRTPPWAAWHLTATASLTCSFSWSSCTGTGAGRRLKRGRAAPIAARRVKRRPPQQVPGPPLLLLLPPGHPAPCWFSCCVWLPCVRLPSSSWRQGCHPPSPPSCRSGLVLKM